MAQIHVNRRYMAMVACAIVLVLVMMTNVGTAERTLKDKTNHEVFNVGKLSGRYEMEFGWKIVVGTIVGFLGAALGSVGGVGGGGFFAPMLTLIIGFDPKSSTAISKSHAYAWNQHWSYPQFPVCGLNGYTSAYHPLHRNFPLISMPLPGTSTKALIKGVDTWKKETVMKKEAAKLEAEESKLSDGAVQDYKMLPSGPSAMPHDDDVPLTQNIHWKELSLLIYVWIGFLVVQIIKEYLQTCSVMYWIVNSLQIPIAASVTVFEAICLYKGRRVIASKGKEVTNWKIYQILLYCSCGIIAGLVGGLLGLGGGFILGPLFLELGVPPQVASATSTFSMAFSSSMSVLQYYLLNRFPIPYGSNIGFIDLIVAPLTFRLPCSCLFCSGSHHCCNHRAACSQENYLRLRTSINNHFHISLDDLCLCNKLR
ncbi:DECREASED DNA METHYLATION 1 family protein [Hibiscus syriacus]|uniref:DECREASED DNA METHYLATION 1 family protein n=1 Tax=Hibiscus syriacus TaxID=106335 RepID=A0A6A2ZZ65_HIBSY|nr:DECREASED DNA METHYLATION 1 family protein [Hibiscus syriacus]